jgi:DNA-binding CsgD family transcriptional regulator
MPLGKLLLDALDQLGYGGIVLDNSEQPLRINQSALHIVNGVYAPAASPQDPNWQAMVTGSFLYRGGRLRFRPDEDGWVAVPRLPRLDSDPNRPLILLALPTEERGASGPQTILILVDLGISPRPACRSLQKIFGLTPNEARLATAMAGGESLEEIAGATNVTVDTLRKQLASIFEKTDTHRQSELVGLLAKLFILPGIQEDPAVSSSMLESA